MVYAKTVTCRYAVIAFGHVLWQHSTLATGHELRLRRLDSQKCWMDQTRQLSHNCPREGSQNYLDSKQTTVLTHRDRIRHQVWVKSVISVLHKAERNIPFLVGFFRSTVFFQISALHVGVYLHCAFKHLADAFIRRYLLYIYVIVSRYTTVYHIVKVLCWRF